MTRAVPLSVERLVEAFSRLPGIGPKTASRLTYYLLKAPEGEALELAEALQSMVAETGHCSICFNITDAGRTECEVCADGSRETALVCVVEEPLDVLAIDRTGAYRGRYHVLHGAISPVEGVGPQDLRLAELERRARKGGIEELILATNPTMEGEATAMFIRRQLEGLPIKITRLARGLPSGGDLEYADSGTLSQALEGRQEL